MSTLKGILSIQVAGEAINALIGELQKKFTPKKGRRFNHGNITYEINRPTLKGNSVNFEISSKVPQDEIQTDKEMDAYFQEMKKHLSKGEHQPVSIEIENIVWDSKKDSEKERDYVKLIYSYPLDDLFDNAKVKEESEKVRGNPDEKDLPKSTGAMTIAGGVVLNQVRKSIYDMGMPNINLLIEANKAIRSQLKK